ncbi:CD3324 family protein [Paenibacillus sp. FSL W7-1287]|uniref:CD3324 family protein n=1 Tax=Paenibacillus sp. FSL W7-1287 TaxID=2954538 RepID=UPI0030FAB9A6
MKYVRGNVIFPENLLKEIQEYIQGEFVYIPQKDGARKLWGEKSGQREQLARRNKEIREKFKIGQSIDRLSKSYHLSHDTIKKIVYSNN